MFGKAKKEKKIKEKEIVENNKFNVNNKYLTAFIMHRLFCKFTLFL